MGLFRKGAELSLWSTSGFELRIGWHSSKQACLCVSLPFTVLFPRPGKNRSAKFIRLTLAASSNSLSLGHLRFMVWHRIFTLLSHDLCRVCRHNKVVAVVSFWPILLVWCFIISCGLTTTVRPTVMVAWTCNMIFRTTKPVRKLNTALVKDETLFMGGLNCISSNSSVDHGTNTAKAPWDCESQKRNTLLLLHLWYCRTLPSAAGFVRLAVSSPWNKTVLSNKDLGVLQRHPALAFLCSDSSEFKRNVYYCRGFWNFVSKKIISE